MPLTRPSSRLVLLALVLALALAWLLPSPSTAASTDAITTLFLGNLTHTTPDPGPADILFTTLAAQATTSIDVALYDFDRASVRDALAAAKSRGLTVRVVGDNEAAANPSYAPFYAGLQAVEIPVVLDDARSSLQHNKFAVFDAAVTWTGSANYSDTGFTRNGENVIVITSTTVAAIYTAEFDEMFDGAFSTGKSDNTPHEVLVGTTPVRVAFAPTDGIEDRIIAALNTADVSIQVAMFTFTSAPLAQALIAAHHRGVAVEVLLDDTADGSQFSQRDPLCEAGVTLRVEDWPAKLHDKYAVIDAGTGSDPLIISGSANWTNSAAAANDENVLIMHDAAAASAFLDDLSRLRAAIGPETFTRNVEQPVEYAAYLPVLLGNSAQLPSRRAEITFIEYDPPGNDLPGEYVEIRNTSGGPLDMIAWSLSDVAGNTYTFPVFTLAGGARVWLWTKSGTDDDANLFWGRAQAVWNNTGDTALLRDAGGVEVSRYTYPSPASQ